MRWCAESCAIGAAIRLLRAEAVEQKESPARRKSPLGRGLRIRETRPLRHNLQGHSLRAGRRRYRMAEAPPATGNWAWLGQRCGSGAAKSRAIEVWETRPRGDTRKGEPVFSGVLLAGAFSALPAYREWGAEPSGPPVGRVSPQHVLPISAPSQKAGVFQTAVDAVQVRTPHRSPSRVAVLSVEAKAPSPVQGAGAALCALSRRRRADGVKPFVHRSGPNRCHLDLLRTAAAIIATRILLWLQKPPFPASGRVRKAEPARSMICPLQRGDKAS